MNFSQSTRTFVFSHGLLIISVVFWLLCLLSDSCDLALHTIRQNNARSLEAIIFMCCCCCKKLSYRITAGVYLILTCLQLRVCVCTLTKGQRFCGENKTWACMCCLSIFLQYYCCLVSSMIICKGCSHFWIKCILVSKLWKIKYCLWSVRTRFGSSKILWTLLSVLRKPGALFLNVCAGSVLLLVRKQSHLKLNFEYGILLLTHPYVVNMQTQWYTLTAEQ